jgi:SNF2 family DNA or RNA helicase
VIAPASVKYQWKTEIEKFTNRSVQVIDGLLPRRKALYASPAFFNLTSYELVLKDIRYMQELRPDLIQNRCSGAYLGWSFFGICMP